MSDEGQNRRIVIDPKPPEDMARPEPDRLLKRHAYLHHTLGGEVLRIGHEKKAPPKPRTFLDWLRDMFGAW